MTKTYFQYYKPSVLIGLIKDQFVKNRLNEPFLLQYIQGNKGFYMAILEPNKTSEISVKEV